MEDQIFDIAFSHDGNTYAGWANPSDKLDSAGKPVSFHIVLNGTSFGYLSHQHGKWVVNEERPSGLVEQAGLAIEKHYTALEESI
jgi:hypothetical protein